MTGEVRIPRRKPSQLRAWRHAQVGAAATPAGKAAAAWDWLRPAIKDVKDTAIAGDLVRDTTRHLITTAEAMDAILPVTPRDATRRATQRRQYQQATTPWARMAAAYGWVCSSAKALSSPRNLAATEHERRAGERDRLLTTLTDDLARIATRAERGDQQ